MARGSTDVDQRFNAQYVVTADKNGVLGRVSSIETKLFYMPAVHLPLTEDEVALNASNPSYLSHFAWYSPTDGFNVAIHVLFSHQFNLNPNVDATPNCEERSCFTLMETTLGGMLLLNFDYFITYYDY